MASFLKRDLSPHLNLRFNPSMKYNIKKYVRNVDRYTLNLRVHALCMASRPAHCLRLHLTFYLAPLNSDLCAIFSDELKSSTNNILHSLPIILHLGENFSNLRRTQQSIMSTPSGCSNVVAYVPLA